MKLNRSLFTLVALAQFAVGAQAQLSLDTSSREQSRVFYNALYPASENVSLGWTGSMATGNAGTTSSAFKQAVFLRINFFRAFAGVPAGITNNATWSAMDQEAALMMSANTNVDHTPPTSWRFYSAAGATAAGKSNLSLSNCGPAAIASYMEDPGSVNTPVGHRRWILFPQTQQMGTGDIPATSSYYAANAIWTLDLNHYADDRPAVRDGFVAWPPKGYVPYQLIFPRWSFSYPDGDFSGASVSMTRNGDYLPVSVQSRVQGYGENTLVFVPNNLDADSWAGPVKPANDVQYRVTVNNVVVNGVSQTFSYDVIAFDPAQAGGDTPSMAINGTPFPKSGIANTYDVAPQVLATGYQWKFSAKGPYNKVIGAEVSGEVDAQIPGRYNYRDKTVKSSGSYSYHLAHPKFAESSITLKYPVLCNNMTTLCFNTRLTYATKYETATVEVSTDGGNQWVPIWSQAGRNSPGEGRFAKRLVALGMFNGREVKVRFRYALRQGSAYTQTAEGVGWYVDNISFSNGQQLLSTVYSGIIPTPTYAFSPVAGNSYVLQVRPLILGNYFGDWSLTKEVTGVQ